MFFDFIFDFRWKLQEWKKKRREKKIKKWGKKKRADKLIHALFNNYCDNYYTILWEIYDLNNIEHLLTLLKHNDNHIKISVITKIKEKKYYGNKDIDLIILNILFDLLDNESKKQKWDISLLKAIISLIKSMKSVDGMLKVFSLGRFRDEAIEFLGEHGDEKALDHLFSDSQNYKALKAVYKIFLRADQKGLTKVKEKIVYFFINKLSEKDYMCQNAAEYLGNIGDHKAIKPLVNFLKINRSDFSHSAAIALQKLGWSPETAIDRAYYYLALKQGEDLVRMGDIGLRVLLDDFLFEYDYPNPVGREDLVIISYLLKFGIAALDDVTNYIVKIDNNILYDKDNKIIKHAYFEKQAILVVFLCLLGNKKACESIIDWLFKYPSLYRGWERQNERRLYKVGINIFNREYRTVLSELFDDYADIILQSSGYTLYWDECSATGHAANVHVRFEESDVSLNELVNIKTEISNNILHKISQKKQEFACRLHSGLSLDDAGIEYREEANKHFEKQRIIAKNELQKRGNPPYDPSLYLDESLWKIRS